MDLRSLQRTLQDAERKLAPSTPSQGRILKTKQEIIEEAERQRVLEADKFRSNFKVRPPSPARLQVLAADRTTFYSELQRKKQEEEAKLSKGVRKGLQTINIEQATQRLYNDFQRREMRLAKLRHDSMANEQSENKPPPTATKSKVMGTPLHERAEDILQRKKENIIKLKIALEEQEIGRRQRNSTVADPQEVTNRLIAEAESLRRKKEQDRLILLEQERPQGKPTIDLKSRLIAEKVNGEKKSFIERQKEEEQKRKERLEARQTIEATKHISKSISGRKVLSPNSAKETAQRLSVVDYYRIQDAREKAAEDYYVSRFTFAPSVDPRSRALAPRGSGGLDSLYRNSEGSKKKRELAKRVEEERMKECTFQPLLFPSEYSLNRRDVSVEEDIERRQREREERVRRAKFEQELREANECTFAPVISRRSSLSTSIVSNDSSASGEIMSTVKGMEAFMERKRQAAEMKEQQRRREEKVFLQNLPPLERRYTVAQPFQLSDSLLSTGS